MLRRFTAVLFFHFLLCVGISAAVFNAPYSAPHGPDVTQHSLQSSEPEAPGTLLNANDHALMDNKDDLPDQLEAFVTASVGTAGTLQAVPLRAARSLSAVVTPPHRPPKQA